MKVKNTVAFRKKVFSTKTELQKFCADNRWCPIINLFLKSHFMSLNKCRNILIFLRNQKVAFLQTKFDFRNEKKKF